MGRSAKFRAVNQVVVALMLVFIAVVVATIFGYMWMHWAESQTTSPKAMVTLSGAKVWALDGGAAVTVYVTNAGDVPVTIDYIRIYSPQGLDCSAYAGVRVNPGESKPVSVVYNFGGYSCTTAPSGSIEGWRVFVEVTYSSNEGQGSVGTAVVAEAPS